MAVHDATSSFESTTQDIKSKGKTIVPKAESDSKSDASSSFYDAVEEYIREDRDSLKAVKKDANSDCDKVKDTGDDHESKTCKQGTDLDVSQIENKHSLDIAKGVKDPCETEFNEQTVSINDNQVDGTKDSERAQADSSHSNSQNDDTMSSLAQDFHSIDSINHKPVDQIDSCDISDSIRSCVKETSVGSKKEDTDSKETNSKADNPKEPHRPKYNNTKEAIAKPESESKNTNEHKTPSQEIKPNSSKLSLKSNLSARSNSEDGDDFYSKYMSPTSPVKSPVGRIGFGRTYSGGLSSPEPSEGEGKSLQDALDYEAAVQRSESLNEEEGR